MEIDRDAHFRKLKRHGMGIGAGSLDRAGGSKLVKPVEHLASGKLTPLRGAQPRHAPALLIDRNEQAIAPVEAAQVIGQPPQLRPIADVARKQDVTRRIGLLEKGALVRGQFKPGNAEYCRRHEAEIRSNGRYRQVRAVSARGKSRCRE